jgi:glycosyltransferase involved in cell wall biosynthesis
VLSNVDAEAGPFDAILLRGFSVCRYAAATTEFAGRLWCYVTDFPQDRDSLTDDHVRQFQAVNAASRVILCQTNEMRSFLETYIPGLSGKTAVLPPLVPDIPDGPPHCLGVRRSARIVYAGKFSRLWRTEELVTAIPAIRATIPDVKLIVAGDKIHDDPSDRNFAVRMEHALRGTEGVEWVGALPREQVQGLIATCALGTSLRDPQLDRSLELSTKVLEYGRAGVPPLLSRTPMHERLLGAEYPLFVDEQDDLTSRVKKAVSDPGAYSAAARAAWRAAQRHTFKCVAQSLQPLIDRICPEPVVSIRERRRLLIAGHDLKFATPLIEHVSALPDVEVRIDKWTGVNAHDEPRSLEDLVWADVILAEWCLGNAVWLSQHRASGQRLVARFHRFERDTNFPDLLARGSIDHIAFVGRHILEEMIPRLSIPREQLSVIENAVPTGHLQRPKLAFASFNLGLLGLSPAMKRLDLAVETLRLLRSEDERFMLYVKGRLPIDHWWIWGREPEREYFLRVGESITRDPLLREAVVFDPHGPDVAEWFRKIGIVLSMSDFESFHLAVAEGIASGSVPIIRNWDGAGEIYSGERIVATPAEAAEAILDAVTQGETVARQREALEARPDLQVLSVCRDWERLLFAPAVGYR